MDYHTGMPMLKNKRIINSLVIITFLIGYLEWGTDNSAFIFQAAWALVTSIPNDWQGLLNPFVLFPFAGIIFLLTTLFQVFPNRKLSLIGLACLAVLIVFLLFIGIISLNIRIVLSVLPFLVFSTLSLQVNWRKKTLGK